MQETDGATAYSSDSDFGYDEAEDFSLAATKDICEISFRGIYVNNTQPTDSFSILIHQDAGGLPGTVVYSESGVTPSRFQTGFFLFGFYVEWQYDWNPANPLILPPGTYWLEIYESGLAAQGEAWYWSTGTLAAGKYDGICQDFGNFPGVNWAFFGPGINLALNVCGQDQVGGSKCSGECTEQANQPPNQGYGYYSDAFWDAGGGIGVSEADDFTLGVTKDICNISWYGFYLRESSPADSFNVLIHADAGGIPGAVVYSEFGVAPSRFQTGQIVQGAYSEWQYDWVPANEFRLSPGTYWLEVFNNLSPEDWAWEIANGGNAFHYYAFEAPGVTWNGSADDLAFVVCGQDQVVGGRECPRTCGMQVEQVGFPTFGFYSDEFCDACGQPQVLADNVVISVDTEICQLVVTGAYQQNSAPADNFTVRILADSGSGTPNDAIQLYCESPQFTYRTPTGNVIFGNLDEYKHTLVATTPWVLSPGTYWVEVYNNLSPDDWIWVDGTLDGANGIPGWAFGFAESNCTPGGTAWSSFAPGIELSLQLCGKDPTNLGENYCPIVDNSAPGAGAALSASGDTSVSSGTPLTLTATDVPNQNGIFFHGENPDQIPFGNGFMCVTGGIVRGSVVAGSGNQATYNYDESNNQHSLAAVQGLSRRFQYWFRDPMGGGAFFNLSDAMCIFIRP